MSAGLNEAHRVCEHLVRVWEDLAQRSDDEDFVHTMTFLLASALTTMGGSVDRGRHRLITSIEVDHVELRLRVEILADENRPQRFEPLGAVLGQAVRLLGRKSLQDVIDRVLGGPAHPEAQARNVAAPQPLQNVR